MKTKFILNFAALIMSLSSYSQIKIFSGGSVTIGATSSPTANAVKHQIIGGKVVFPATTTTAITSAPLINGCNGYSSASAPDYTWLGDVQTGIFHRTASELNISINNSEKFRFNSSNQILSVNTTSSATTPDYSWIVDQNTGVFHPADDNLAFASNGAERMRVNNAGNILIGTTTQSNGERAVITGASNQQPLSIYVSNTTDAGYGEIVWVNQNHTKAFSIISNATGTYTENAFIYGNGDAWGKSWTGWSDKNLKENIDSIPDALNKVRQLKGVRYNFKASVVGADDASKTEMGLIAQDVEKVVPEVVKTSDKGIKGITYHNLIALLIEAIKAQDQQISKLQNDVSNCCSKTGATPQQNRTINNPDNNNNNSSTYTGNSYINQNTPNPFNKETSIDYFVAEKNADASILVFDMNGKLLKTYKVQTGKNSLLINGNELQPGMYYYSLVVNNKEVGTKKMILTE